MTKSSLQKLVLVCFLALALLGISEAEFLKRFSYLTNYVVWYVWWPGLMILALFSIRFWCMVCPLRTVAGIYSKVGMGLKVPEKLEHYRIMVMAGIFLVLHHIITTSGVSQFAIVTSVYLLVLIGYSAVIGLIFQRKYLCRVFCPLGAPMEIFSKLGIVKMELPCTSCQVNGGGGCTGRSKDCTEDSFSAALRNPLRNKPKIEGPGENLAVILLFGVMIAEFTERLGKMAISYGNWNVLLEKALTYIPHKLELLGNSLGYRMLLFFWEYLLFPFLLILTGAFLLRILFGRSLREHWANLISSMVPLIYSGFLVVLINYPLTLLDLPSGLRKLLLLLIMFLGAVTALITFWRSRHF